MVLSFVKQCKIFVVVGDTLYDCETTKQDRETDRYVFDFVIPYVKYDNMENVHNMLLKRTDTNFTL